MFAFCPIGQELILPSKDILLNALYCNKNWIEDYVFDIDECKDKDIITTKYIEYSKYPSHYGIYLLDPINEPNTVSSHCYFWEPLLVMAQQTRCYSWQKNCVMDW